MMGYRLVGEIPRGLATWKEFLTKRPDGDNNLPLEYLVRNCANERWGDGGYAWLPQEWLLTENREAFGLIWRDEDEADTQSQLEATPRASTAKSAARPKRRPRR
jgi:hypothetical protein